MMLEKLLKLVRVINNPDIIPGVIALERHNSRPFNVVLR